MTPAKTAPAPSSYWSGHCAAGFHDRCRGTYAGVTCGCEHHTATPELEPEPAPAPSSRPRHCATCTCEDPR